MQRLSPLIDVLAGHDPRFAVYRERFDAAMAAVDSGRHELVSSPTSDSVHNVWFEFHEDLLRTLGQRAQRSRGSTWVSGYTVTFHDADPDDVDLLGGKGAGLARMTQSGPAGAARLHHLHPGLPAST